MRLLDAIRAAWLLERLPPHLDYKDALSHAGGLGPLLAAPDAHWEALGLPPGARPPDSLLRQAFGAPVDALGWDDADYPRGLRLLGRPPMVLFVRGAGPLPPRERCVAIIGARRCTEAGRWVARDLAEQLAAAGVTVLSGLALGIDAAAHEGALSAGKTLAVLASPVDHPTPERHRDLASDILSEGGWLVSERPPGRALKAADFPRRNRLVAALSSVVVVVEAGVASGTLSTVGYALQLGVEVGAVPGPVTSPASAGSMRLLREGACVITGARDVLELLGDPIAAQQQLPLGADAQRADEQRVLAGVAGSVAPRNRWLADSGLPRAQAERALAGLLARGALRCLPGERIARSL